MADVMMAKEKEQALNALKQFWHWWSGRLRELVPPRLLGAVLPSRSVVRVVVEPGGTRFELGDSAQVLGTLDLLAADSGSLRDSAESVLAALPERVQSEVLLADEFLLVNDFQLPLATESNLNNVLQFELDRLTPFTPAQANYDFEVAGRYPEIDKLVVRLYVVKRDWVEQIQARLAALGLQPERFAPLSVKGERAGGKTLNLLSPSDKPPKQPIWDRDNRRLGYLALALLVVALVYPAYMLGNKLESLEKRLAEIRPEASEVADKQATLATRLAAQEQLVKRKNHSPGTLEILHRVTELLPDNTWVSRLTIKGRKLVLQGESRKASDLIELLEKSPHFQNVAFNSSITRNPSTNMERYELSMEVEEGGLDG